MMSHKQAQDSQGFGGSKDYMNTEHNRQESSYQYFPLNSSNPYSSQKSSLVSNIGF